MCGGFGFFPVVCANCGGLSFTSHTLLNLLYRSLLLSKLLNIIAVSVCVRRNINFGPAFIETTYYSNVPAKRCKLPVQ